MNEIIKEIKAIPHFGRRCIVLLIGLVIMAFGVAFSIQANLGTSPISSVPYAISAFTPLTVGTATILLHCVLILIQVVLLRKNFKLFQLLQLIVAIVFGYLCDFALWMLQGVTYSSYIGQWLLCIIGIVLVAFAVSLEVLAGVITLAGEGTVLALCQVFPKVKFGNMKVAFDASLVLIACLLGLVFMGSIQGVREGTLAAALCVGLFTKLFNKPLTKINDLFLA